MKTSVQRYELAPGLSISRVLTGLWQIADMEREENSVDITAAAEAMRPYVAAGLTTFDMADHYGSAELIAGEFQQRYDPNRKTQLFTKWVPSPGAVTREDVRQAVTRALERLKSEQIDLLQFHAWNYADPTWLDCLFWLQELQAEGLIAHLGLTNFDTAHLRVAVYSGIKIVSNQVCFSLIDRRPLQGMTDFCREHGIGLLCYGTVAGGFLTERWLDKPEPAQQDIDTWSGNKYKRFIDAGGGWEPYQLLLKTMKRVAQRHGVSMANVACRYVLAQPGVAGIIVGARLGKSEHLRDNLRLFDFELDEASRTELAEATARLTMIPGESGDEYRKPPFLTASGDLSHHLSQIPPPYTPRAREGRTDVLSGTPWESFAGYCRAVRKGNRISVSGTTATHGDRVIGGADPAAQTHFVIDKIEGAIQSLGGQLNDVVRTRIFVNRIDDWEAVARAHGERFKDIQPANTLVQATLVGEEYLVEIEAEAVVSTGNE